MARRKGELTGSDRVKTGTTKRRGRPPKKEKLETPTLDGITDGITKATDNLVDGIAKVRDTVQTVGNTAKKVRAVFNPSELVTSDSTQALDTAKSMAATFGVQLENIDNMLAGSNFEIDESIPQMTSKEANQMQLIIERQNNALDVGNSRIKQKRKQARNYKEQLNLVGDVVDIATTQKQVATKVVDYQIADTDFQIKQSKLEEKEELLEQQIIRTQGVISLTEPIRNEWDLKLEKQHASNEALMIQIEQTNNKNSRDREKVESFLFSEGE